MMASIQSASRDHNASVEAQHKAIAFSRLGCGVSDCKLPMPHGHFQEPK